MSCAALASLSAVFAIALATAGPALAAIHKCAGAGGTTYQDRPCDASGAIAGFDDTTATLSVLPSPRGTTVVRREVAAKPARVERVRKAEPQRVGDPHERKHLRVGMSEGEVITRAGPPDLTTGKGRRQSRWTWLPVAADPDTITVLLFEVGRVVEVERTVVKR